MFSLVVTCVFISSDVLVVYVSLVVTCDISTYGFISSDV